MSFFKLLLLVVMTTSLSAEVIPKVFLKAMESEDFRERESAQSDLLSWVRKNPKAAVAELLRHSTKGGSSSPEVRERCMQVLRQLAADDFAKEGDGYLGVRMNDRMVRMPGNQPDRWAVVVTEVVADSAAAKCGLKAGDAIVGLNGQTWQQEASKPFSEQIRKRKPGTRVNLRVLRDEGLQDLRVDLGRRPADADQFIPNMDPEGQQALEQKAKEAYFERWLLEKKGPR
jgi:predicted metalloprotease with PDZ domain